MSAGNDLIATDPLVAHNFFLEIDGKVVTTLSSIDGIDMELDVSSITQVGDKGMLQIVKTLGNQFKAPDLTMTRMAPADSTKDELWKWFLKVRGSGMPNANRTMERKNGSIVIYDTSNAETARYNFYNAWPSKISTAQLSADSNDPVTETITLVCERLERVK
jgi:phage tail-like protein